jgi:hypothetical protein
VCAGEAGASVKPSSTPAAHPADDGDAPRRRQGREPIDPVADRARRDRVLADAGQVEPAHGRADVEARDVVGHRRATLERDRARVRIDRRRAREDHVRAGAPREAGRVDLELVRRVVAGREARHHAGVDRHARGRRRGSGGSAAEAP